MYSITFSNGTGLLESDLNKAKKLVTNVVTAASNDFFGRIHPLDEDGYEEGIIFEATNRGGTALCGF